MSIPTTTNFQAIGQPILESVQWSDIIVQVDGVACSHSQADEGNFMQDRFWHFTGAGYEVYSSQLPPNGEASLKPYHGYWVYLEPESMGRDIKLLIPLGGSDRAVETVCDIAS